MREAPSERTTSADARTGWLGSLWGESDNTRIRTASRTSWWRDFDRELRPLSPTDFSDEVGRQAVHGLFESYPNDSAKQLLSPQQRVALFVAILAAGYFLAVWPIAFMIAFNVATTLYFLSAIAFRVFLVALGWRDKVSAPTPPTRSNWSLPTITVLLPLYRDAEALPMLARAIRTLEYPQHKKDVKLLLEEHDQETIQEAYRLRLDKDFHIIIIPSQEPRTKPKACNVGLALARGELTVIYDAEDAPESDQLLKAAAAFEGRSDKLACVQARLNYYNRDDNWLTRGIMAQMTERKNCGELRSA